MNITYQNTNQSIRHLLEMAESGKAVIPSIQRPFVWEPKKVAKFIDSLLRGWPFGTMLFMQDAGIELFNCHAFALDGDEPHTKNREEIVLDGQQRYQSLLIAFSEKSKGFTLTKEEWDEQKCPSSRAARHEKITKYLCFNLKAWSPSGTPLIHSDADNEEDAWLTWKTNDEISKNTDFILLSRIFANKLSDGSAAMRYLKERINCMNEKDVPVLKIQVVGDAVDNIETLEEQIVDIFTRLNTQGTALTHEQILAASITQAWEEFPDKVSEMRRNLCSSQYNMSSITDDDLVTGFNLILKVATGEKNIRKAYATMKSHPHEWDRTWNRFESLTKGLLDTLINKYTIRYTKEYKSLHALWFVVALMYKCGIETRNIANNGTLIQAIIRWFMVTTWAKIWANSSKTYVDHFTGKLLHDSDHREVCVILNQWLLSEVGRKTLKLKATNAIHELQAPARNNVRLYYTPLLVWMRMEENRAKLLTAFEYKYEDWDVDHIIPAAWNEAKRHEINSIGNCWLLNPDANIKKSDDSFIDFCKAYKVETPSICACIEADGFEKFSRQSLYSSMEDVCSKIAAREKLIKSALAAYIETDSPSLFFTMDENPHGYHFNVENVYRGAEFTESNRFKSYSPQTQHDYFLGVQNALTALKWSQETGPCASGCSAQDIIAYIRAHHQQLIDGANLQNKTYISGFNSYLKFIVGVQTQRRNFHGRKNRAAIVARAIIAGCTKRNMIQNELVISHLQEHEGYVKSHLNTALTHLRDKMVLDRAARRGWMRFTQGFWNQHEERIKQICETIKDGAERYDKLFDYFGDI